jgi:hypothetical protein
VNAHPAFLTKHDKPDKMIAGPETDIPALAYIGYARVSSRDQDPAL